MFYKGSKFKGIYFIEEGEVQSTSGRVVARGWVTNGKCNNSGYGWKFKPLPFFKFIAKNYNIWKQFINDLTLNKEYPFKLSYILNLAEEPDTNAILEKKNGNKMIRLPKLAHSSFDYTKLTEIDKVKHYDERLNDMYEFKKRLVMGRKGGSLNKQFTQVLRDDENNDAAKKQREMLHKNNLMSRRILSKADITFSNENILVMSVLKKL